VQVDDAELHFLILHFLASGPCQQAVLALEQEAASNALLPMRTDFRGDLRAACFRAGFYSCSSNCLQDTNWIQDAFFLGTARSALQV